MAKSLENEVAALLSGEPKAAKPKASGASVAGDERFTFNTKKGEAVSFERAYAHNGHNVYVCKASGTIAFAQDGTAFLSGMMKAAKVLPFLSRDVLAGIARVLKAS